jgi:hypothetical protein
MHLFCGRRRWRRPIHNIFGSAWEFVVERVVSNSIGRMRGEGFKEGQQEGTWGGKLVNTPFNFIFCGAEVCQIPSESYCYLFHF